MSEPVKKEKSAAAKALTIFAVGLLVSLGLCGVTSRIGGQSVAVGVLGVAGAVLFVVSLIGAGITLLIIIVGMIAGSFQK
jgi:hypothetical protein